LISGLEHVEMATQAGSLSADVIVAQHMIHHALDFNMGGELLTEQFVRHMFTGSCVITASSGGGGRVCTAIAKGFCEASILVDYLLGILSSPGCKRLTLPLIRIVLRILNVDGVSSHASRSQLLSILTQFCRGTDSSHFLRDLFVGFETLSYQRLVDFASLHGLHCDDCIFRDDLQDKLMSHLTDGSCWFGRVSNQGCLRVCNECALLPDKVSEDKRHLQC
ncbi:hypothetical protein P692DRAFT_20759881, partial [Suillus brevipes Sb2]